MSTAGIFVRIYNRKILGPNNRIMLLTILIIYCSFTLSFIVRLFSVSENKLRVNWLDVLFTRKERQSSIMRSTKILIIIIIIIIRTYLQVCDLNSVGSR